MKQGRGSAKTSSADRFRAVVAAPYPEGAVTAIAAALTQRADVTVFTSFHAHTLQRLSWVFPSQIRARVRRRALRRSWPGLEADHVHEVALFAEAIRMAAYHLPISRATASRAMYWQKRRFDLSVASTLGGSAADLFVGIQASAMASLRASRRLGLRSVLHFVNSHPAVQNRLLREIGGVPAGHHELIRDDVARDGDAELYAAELVLVPSAFVADQLVQRGVPIDRIRVEPYGVDVSRFLAQPGAAAGGPRTRYLFLGQISHRKGVKFLLEAARKVPEVDFTLIGPLVSPEVMQRMPENVRYLGERPFAELPGIMAGYDAFVLPSLEDAYPLAVLEAMAAKLPVITTDHVGNANLVQQFSAGIVVPVGNSEAIASAVMKLQQDPVERTAMGERGRLGVENAHTWTHYGARVATLLCDWARL